MRRNFLYLGIILLVSGIALGLSTPGFTLPTQGSNQISVGVIVNASALGYLPVRMNQSGLVILTFNSSSAVDFYFANATAFGQISVAQPAIPKARSTAMGLEGNGVYEVYTNSINGAFPYTGFQGVATPVYLLNVSLLQAGTYYGIFANAGNKTAQIAVMAIPISLSTLQSSATSLGVYFGAAFLLFIAGIALIIFSLVSKGGQKKQDAMDQAAANEYERIEKQEKK